MDASLKQHLLASQGPAAVAAMEAKEAKYAGIVPTLIDVKITQDPPHSGWLVSPVWSDVDRAANGGWVVATKTVADRLARALRAGVAVTDPHVGVDVNLHTYASYTSHVLSRRMNADLKRLGY